MTIYTCGMYGYGWMMGPRRIPWLRLPYIITWAHVRRRGVGECLEGRARYVRTGIGGVRRNAR